MMITLEEAVQNNDDLGSLIEETTRIVFEEDEVWALVLDYYMFEKPDLLSDVKKVKAKIELKKAILVDKEEIKQQEKLERERLEIEKLRLQLELSNRKEKGSVTINNSNHNESNAVSNVNTIFEQTLENLNNLQSEYLSDEDMSDLEEKIFALDGAKKSGDKQKLSIMFGKILKYVADKGVEVGIAVLPYLGEISKFLRG